MCCRYYLFHIVAGRYLSTGSTKSRRPCETGRKYIVTLSLTRRELLETSDFHFVASKPSAQITAVPVKKSNWAHLWRHSPRTRGPVHALLADAQGVWAWSPRDPHAEATRHASVQAWITTHPGCDLGLWVSGQLVCSLPRTAASALQDDETVRSNARRELVELHGAGAASWALATWKNDAARGVCALAGINLAELNLLAREHGVQIQSVVPWWYHAFQEARRCVDALNHAVAGHVCVVEGRQIAWITTTRGLLAAVRQMSLANACIAELRHEIGMMMAHATDQRLAPVVLGQGLEDGARTSDLDALVLGRLDGLQPPQWLRPSFQQDML